MDATPNPKPELPRGPRVVSPPPPPAGPLQAGEPLAGSGRSADGEIRAWAVSFAVHVGGLLLLCCVWQAAPSVERFPLLATLPEPEAEAPPEEFRFSERLEEEVGALSEAGVGEALAAVPVESDLPEVIEPIEPVALIGSVRATPLAEPVLRGPVLQELLRQKGQGSVAATGASGAVDRITHEVLLSLDQRPTLLVWLFDQSGSLAPQREEIARRLDRVYRELGVVEQAEDHAFTRHRDKPLLSAVAQFGFEPKLLTREPTDDVAAIQRAVRGVEDTDRGLRGREGKENVYRAIGTVVQRFGHYRRRSPRRNLMIVVFTDEAGDDIGNLEGVIRLCRRLQTPVFVVGVPAPFGRENSIVKYVDPNPAFDQTPQDAPVHTGPESPMPERLKLGLLGGDPRGETLDSGFGPYGLTRLCYETGGTYFAVHPNRRVGALPRRETAAMATYVSHFFDPRLMRRYRPDYLPLAEYTRLLQKNRARHALVKAAAFSRTAPLEGMRTVFEKRDEASFAESLSIAQRGAAKLEPRIHRLVTTLLAGERDRPRLESPRWRAGYDLALGRSLAVQVRAEGYNLMLAAAKRGMEFDNPRNDTWVIRPADEISTGSVLAKRAKKATEYLTRVTREHGGTPWALLASRELATPLGWRWDERYTGVAARMARREGVVNNARPRPPRPPRDLPPRKETRPPPAL